MCHSHTWGGRKIRAKWVALRLPTVASRSACWATWAFSTALSSVPPRALMMWCFLEECSLCLWGSFQAADTHSASSDVCSQAVATISLWPHGRQDPERQSDFSEGKMCFLETLWKLLSVKGVDNIWCMSLCLNPQPMETHKLLLNQMGAGGESFWGQVMEGWDGRALWDMGAAERWLCSQPGEQWVQWKEARNSPGDATLRNKFTVFLFVI